MSQFVVYKNTDKNTSNAYPYFIDLQSDFLSGLNSRLVAPLTPADLLENKAPSHLCPIIKLQDEQFVVLTHQMASMPSKLLSQSIADMSEYRDELVGAIDFLITGI